MQTTELANAVRGVILALTKLETVLQSTNDAVIHQANDVDTLVTTPIATTATAPVADLELDDEGIPWDDRIHAGSKSQVASKIVSKGKAWRLKKGVDQDEVERVKAEWKAKLSGQTAAVTPATQTNETAPVTQAAPTMTAPGIPSGPAPVSAPAPGGPGIPAVNAPSNPSEDSKISGLRKATIADMKALNDLYKFDHEDCKEVMRDVFGTKQEDGTVVFGGLRHDQFEEVYNFFHGLLEKYGQLDATIKRIYEVAGFEQKSAVDGGVRQILGNFNTDQVGGVHYSAIDESIQQFKDWLGQWENWAAQMQGSN